MAKYGYARVSTNDQNCAVQIEALEKAGCSVIKSEKVSGTSMQGRVELDNILTFISEGDVLVCTRIDRLGRSVKDLEDIVLLLKAKGASLKATEQDVDTSTATGKAFFGMLQIFAEYETNLRSERQMEGIRKAKEKGNVYKGRQASIDPQEVQTLKQQGLGATAISRKLNISRQSVYRLLAA